MVKNNLKVGAIIQARMGSSRLPGKILKLIGKRPMLYYVVERVKMTKGLNSVILATSNLPLDDQVVNFCREFGYTSFRGSETNVLSRYYLAAKKYDLDVIVRVTGDDPFVDPKIIETVLDAHLKEYPKYDFTSNDLEASYPYGLNVQIMNFNVLEEAFKKATKEEELEHVVPYLTNKGVFKLQNVKAKADLNFPKIRLTVDTMEEFEKAEKIFKLFDFELYFSTEELLEKLKIEKIS